MSSLPSNDLKEIKQMLTQVIQNQTVMMAQLVCMAKDPEKHFISNYNGANISAMRKQLEQLPPSNQKIPSPTPVLPAAAEYKKMKVEAPPPAAEGTGMMPSGSGQKILTQLMPMKHKVKRELPLEEIGNNGGVINFLGRDDPKIKHSGMDRKLVIQKPKHT